MAARWLLPAFFAATALLGGRATAADPPPEELFERGRKAEALAIYDDAARFYESFVRLAPKSSEAPTALSDAIVFRLGLGQVDQASEDVDLFTRNYGATKPAQAAEAALGLAGHLIEHEDLALARKRLEAWLGAFDRSARLDQRVTAHAWLARALGRQRDAKKAEAEYTRTRDLWKDGPAAPPSQGGVDDVDARRLGRAINAAGEALFFFAEQKRAEADAIRMPVYKGRGALADIKGFLNEKILPWIKKKRPAIEAAEKEYTKVLNLKPAPPPVWVIASAARVGQMWARFVIEFRTTPIPAEWKQHGEVPGAQGLTYDELRRAYYEAVDDAAEPQKQQAKRAFRTCLDYAAKFQQASAYARACERWLTRHYRAEFPPLDELMPRPIAVASPMPPGAPLEEPPREQP